MTTYRAAPTEAWVAVELEPFTALYHRPSGSTHLLVEPAPQLLEALAGEGLTLAALRARLEAMFDLADGDDAVLEARLEELVAAGLVAVA
ncbi:HPr-rel-A system PqqD family peptide chaperone [Sphingomonas sp.]|uniref:HPr-rel-A system PqqD family peptide chaperone n=1 Tax=Sphingomonas sp. TaxID=28214 RepID=UPI002D80F04E|nr:HPr-rel-A system PqqD family peptide chaperone [Sphingomonas sp.]HEU0044457.1 HPr-rel-A system PqqD family peptide chaperone [Sphingomonas sp.]